MLNHVQKSYKCQITQEEFAWCAHILKFLEVKNTHELISSTYFQAKGIIAWSVYLSRRVLGVPLLLCSFVWCTQCSCRACHTSQTAWFTLTVVEPHGSLVKSPTAWFCLLLRTKASLCTPKLKLSLFFLPHPLHRTRMSSQHKTWNWIEDARMTSFWNTT